MTVTIRGDLWQPNMTREWGPSETATHHDEAPDFARLIKDYELRHGRCASFEIKIVK